MVSCIFAMRRRWEYGMVQGGTFVKKCEWCNYTDEKWLLLKNEYWTVYLADEQDYIGRCILVLNRHCGSLSKLEMQEWIALKKLIDKLEKCFKVVLGAEVCNWSCLMNSFYKCEEPNPHLHIHVRPRYKNTLNINTNTYCDAEYGHHYKLKKEIQLVEADRVSMFELMKEKLNVGEEEYENPMCMGT